MKEEIGSFWEALHGSVIPEEAWRLNVDAAGELSPYRPPDLLLRSNVMEAAIEASAHSHGLLLWEPLVSVLPSRSLGNGDMLFTFIPPAGVRDLVPAVLLWNHELDRFVAPSSGDLGEVHHPGPAGDPTRALLYAARSGYLINILVRGSFSASAYCPVRLNTQSPSFWDMMRLSPPASIYTMWQMFFTGQDELLPKVMDAAEQSPARWIRDTALLLRELVGGRNQLGAMDDVSALRREVTAAAADPAAAMRLERRTEVELQLARLGPPTLVRDDGPGLSVTPATSAQLGDLTLQVVEARPRQFRLVLRREGRSLDAMPLAGVGGGPDYLPHFHLVQTEPLPLFVMWHPSDPGSPQHPWDGLVQLHAVKEGRLVSVATWTLDVQDLETRNGNVLVRTADGAAYRLAALHRAEPQVQQVPPVPLPGTPASPPASSPPPELGRDRLELTPRSLQLWRGERMLFEESFPEAYAMTAIPSRRMVAVHRADFELKPVVDVIYGRELKRAVKPGNGCCTWVSFPVTGLDVKLASSEDALFIQQGSEWIQVEEAQLTTVPSWIRSRGWVSEAKASG